MKGLEIRTCEKADSEPLKRWIFDPETTPLFPVSDPKEIEDAACRWVELAMEQNCGLTALYQGTPVGFGVLFLQNYVELTHQCVHILLVDRAYQKMGIGSALLNALMDKARAHNVELLHVEVYDDPDIERFYKKHGFKEFARQEKWSKENHDYRSRVLLERFL